jgi:hypothetical protein
MVHCWGYTKVAAQGVGGVFVAALYSWFAPCVGDRRQELVLIGEPGLLRAAFCCMQQEHPFAVHCYAGLGLRADLLRAAHE